MSGRRYDQQTIRHILDNHVQPVAFFFQFLVTDFQLARSFEDLRLKTLRILLHLAVKSRIFYRDCDLLSEQDQSFGFVPAEKITA